MKTVSPLDLWVEGRIIPELLEMRGSSLHLHNGLWVSINERVPMHEIKPDEMLGLNEAWQLSHKYFEEAKSIALDYNGDLDHEDRADVLRVLGPPPRVSNPLYFIVIEKDGAESLMYVGKSGSDLFRFVNGHPTALALLNPIYDGYRKYIYLAQVVLYHDELGHVPLEFLGDIKTALTILDDIESRLIWYFKPKLNTKKTKTFNSEFDYTITIEGYEHSNGFTKLGDVILI